MTGPATRRAWLAELAWSPRLGLQRNVLIEAEAGRFTAVSPDAAAARPEPDRAGPDPAGLDRAGPDRAGLDRAGLDRATRLRGLTIPGLANAHSHAFHRALRGTTQASRGTFWTWRERMYEVAARLDPDSYLALARAVYAEMTLAGISCVGEFHYLHHGPGGTPYADPTAMGRALVQAAADAGLRISLLDTCYLAGGLSPDGRPLELAGPQLRFGDGDGARWAARVEALGDPGPGARVGAAIHSVRAVPPDQMAAVTGWSHQHAAPVHAHLSEQVAENVACLAAYGRTPAQILLDAGALGPRTSVVHATHLTAADISVLGQSQSYACFCPTTEADLADGIGPASALTAAGSPLTLGSDSHAVIDLLAEARGVELGERLASQERGHFTAAELACAATVAGHASLGWPEAGQLAPGGLADLVTVRLDSVRTAGATDATALESVIFGATAADVTDVVIGGRDVVRDGEHLLLADVPGRLGTAIRAVLG